MLTSEQLEMRANGLGASEIPSAAGLNPFKPPMQLWLERTKRIAPFQGNEHTEMGNLLEPGIVSWWEKTRGATDCVNTGTVLHPKHDWLFATPDRKGTVEGAPMLCEAKWVGWRMRDHWPDGECPEYVTAQSLIQQEVLGIHNGEVAAWIEGSAEPRRIVAVPWGPEIAQALVEIGEEFWRECVLKDKPPAIDASEAWGRYLANKWPKNKRPLIEASPDADAIAWKLEQAYRDQKRADMRVAEAEHEIMNLIGDRDGIERWRRWKATWKLDKVGRVHWKALALELGATPKQIKAHTGAPGRRFLFNWKD